MTNTDFAQIGLKANLTDNLSTLGYEVMTPIQAKSLPPILAQRDVIAQGKTGSGKTAAFGLGLLNKLDVKQFRVQSLILCPTRELADQVAKELRRLARGIHNVKVLTLCGGVPFGPQAGSLEHGAHIVVGTPGRVEEHLRKQKLKVNGVQMLVLDEADRMLEMGFEVALNAILEHLPQQRQTLLFSATFPMQIESMARQVLQDPVRIEIDTTHDSSTILQHFYKVDNKEQRMTALRLLLLDNRPQSTVVFSNTKKECQEIASKLSEWGFSVLTLHGDLEQRERDQALARFASNCISILVATDVASRGLDIAALDAVINYHIAQDPEVHIHRVGRTGRAGSIGMACSLFSDKEQTRVEMLGHFLGMEIVAEALPQPNLLKESPMKPPMILLQIDGGKRQKLRPGDLLGALTRDGRVEGSAVGKIQISESFSYVAIRRNAISIALDQLTTGKLKGRSFRARQIG